MARHCFFVFSNCTDPAREEEFIRWYTHMHLPKSSLTSHRSTSAVQTKVETTDGVVTVSGIAKNAAEKSLVTKLVNDINGVTRVINNMTIAVAAASNN